MTDKYALQTILQQYYAQQASVQQRLDAALAAGDTAELLQLTQVMARYNAAILRTEAAVCSPAMRERVLRALVHWAEQHRPQQALALTEVMMAWLEAEAA